MLATSQRLLEAAPQRQVRKVIRRLAPDIQYVGTDLMDLRFVEVCADALALPFADGVFDVAVHFHVFEHIPDDRGAMREVARVLRPGGLMICQVPRRSGTNTDEAFDLSPDENLARFGQVDHVRYYGDDFEDRLRESGLDVVTYTAREVLAAEDLERFNIPPGDRLWFASTAAVGGASNAELLRLNRELAATQHRYERLRSRKVVKAGLAAAAVAKPVIDAFRRMTSGGKA
jgi:SAM-dependent methyltransferase